MGHTTLTVTELRLPEPGGGQSELGHGQCGVPHARDLTTSVNAARVSKRLPTRSARQLGRLQGRVGVMPLPIFGLARAVAVAAIDTTVTLVSLPARVIGLIGAAEALVERINDVVAR